MTDPKTPNRDRPIKGIIKDPCIVTFTGEPTSPYLPYDLKLLCGVVEENLSGRFKAGMQFHSSPVQDVSGDLVTTTNSLYSVTGEVDQVNIPYKYLPQILELTDPRDIKLLLDEGFTEIYGAKHK